MFATLKKLVGADEEGKARRREALEEERRERQQRVAERQAELKKHLEAQSGNKSDT